MSEDQQHTSFDEGGAEQAFEDDPPSDEFGEDPAVVSTGEFRVDSALSRLEELAGVPVEEHVAVYDDIHAQLKGALADLDER